MRPDAVLRPAWFASVMAGLGPWGADRRVAVAVSGGADSLCLARLAAGWGRPFALIVDHGLRPEAPDEASQAAERLRGFGVPSRILTLRVAPGPGLAARARAARYAALAQAAAEAGLSDLLLGHHARDQAETLLIRREGQSGPAGLSGMAAIVETPSLRLVRPLLDAWPDSVRATLAAHGLDWAEDPSNDSPTATRTRMRGWLADRTCGADRARTLSDEQHLRAAARAEREGRIAEVLARRAVLFPEGHALLSPGPIEPDCLASLIRALTGAAYPIGSAALARFATMPAVGTLGGLRFLPAGRLGPGTLLVREAAAMQAPVVAEDGALWDGRFRLQLPDGAMPGVTLGALGDDSRLLRHRTALPAAVLRSLPALRSATGGLAVPHLPHFIGWTNGRVRLTFCPSSPVAGAPFRLSRLGDAQRMTGPHVPDEASTSVR